jgi:hypothetical protein
VTAIPPAAHTTYTPSGSAEQQHIATSGTQLKDDLRDIKSLLESIQIRVKEN